MILEHDPFFIVEAMTIAGHRHRLRARLPVPARRVPAGLGAARRGDHRRPRARLPRPGHPRPGLRVRHRAAQGRRRLHLRRGDRALQLDRGLPRRAAQQAAVPGRRGPVRQADRDQQRRDARQRARHRHGGRPGVREDRHRGLDRHAPVLPVRPDRAARPLRGAVRHHAARGARAGRRRARRAPAAHDPARRRRRAASSRPTSSTSRCRSRPRARPGSAWAPAS